MLAAHRVVAFAVLGATALAAVWGGFIYLRHGGAGQTLVHVLALVQTLLVAQVGLGLLLLSDDRRAPDDLHYVYGSLALGAVLAPWLYAPTEPRRRLAWFSGASSSPEPWQCAPTRQPDAPLLRRHEPDAARLLIIALIALVSCSSTCRTRSTRSSSSRRSPSSLAIAFFLYLLWRERRGEISVVAGDGCSSPSTAARS